MHMGSGSRSSGCSRPRSSSRTRHCRSRWAGSATASARGSSVGRGLRSSRSRRRCARLEGSVVRDRDAVRRGHRHRGVVRRRRRLHARDDRLGVRAGRLRRGQHGGRRARARAGAAVAELARAVRDGCCCRRGGRAARGGRFSRAGARAPPASRPADGHRLSAVPARGDARCVVRAVGRRRQLGRDASAPRRRRVGAGRGPGRRARALPRRDLAAARAGASPTTWD